MGTFNANTLREDARLAELAHCAEEQGMEILRVQEHRRVHQDPDPIVGRCTGWRQLEADSGMASHGRS